MNARTQLEIYLDQFRRRLKRLVFARSAALLAVTALVVTLVTVWFGTRRAFDAEFMTGARLVLLAAMIAIIVGLLVVPLRALKRSRAVPEIERRAPEFDGRIETYDDLAASGRKSPFLALLAEDALRFARKVPVMLGVSKLELSLPTVVGGVAVLALVGLAVIGPGNWRYGVRDLWAGWLLDDTLPPQFIAVDPGDGTVRRGGDMRITAEARGFDPATMNLYARVGPRNEWQSTAMRQRPDDSWEFTFFAVREPVTYYVTAAGVRSREFSLDVVDLPEISRIRLTYDYPEWTRLADVVEDPGYDIRAVEGTTVTLEVETNEPLDSPNLVVDGNPVAMTSTGNISTGTLTVEDDGEYFVTTLFNDEQVQVSDEFFITVVEDKEPELSIVRPGRDWRASSVEEVTIAVEGRDDFGIESAEIRYSVNGSEWESIPLAVDGTDVAGDGLIYLEDLTQPILARASRVGGFDPRSQLTIDDVRSVRGRLVDDGDAETGADAEAEAEAESEPTERSLEPGDLISYYAVVEDRGARVETDLYFIEVQPFDRRFSQSDGAGGGGGGQQAQRDEISRRQKEILTATWNLIREQDEEAQASFLDEQQLEDNARMLAEVQRTLAEQAQSLVERAQARRLDNADPRINQYVENMELAVGSMGPASELLEEVALEEAVAPAQQALQYILRAEALFTDIEVSMQQGQGGGGGGGLAGRDFAELYELELDLDRNQYETEQALSFENQGGEEGSQEIDEAIRKLQELARRQEQLAEQARRRQELSDRERWEQRSLQRETEELLRELEDLQQQLAQAQQQAEQQQEQQGQQAQQGQPGQPGQQGQQGQPGQPGQPGQGQQGQISPEQLAETIEQLQRALSAMNRGGDPDIDPAAARREAERAREQLEQALAQATEGRREAAGEAFADLTERAGELYARQQRAAEELQRAIEAAIEERARNNASSARLDNDTADQLSQERFALADEVGTLQEDVQRIAQEFRRQAPEATRELDEALAELQETQVSANLEAGASLIWRGDGARVAAFDINITSALRDLERNAERAEELAMREVVEGDLTEPDPNAELIAEIQNVRRQLAAARAAGQRGQPGQGQQGQQDQQGQPGQPGQQGGGQQGGARNGQGDFGGVFGFDRNGGAFGPDDLVDINRSGVWDPLANDFWNDPQRVDELREELGATGAELINLGQQLRGIGLSDEELQAVRELGDALRGSLRGNPELVEAEVQALINLTEQIELRLQADGKRSESTVRTEAPTQVAQGFEDAVAEYYRRLGRSPD